jgi:segregation and condensation protein A
MQKNDKKSQPLPTSSWPRTFALSILDEMVQIKVEGFDGPIDLLLDLIESKQLDITALSLAEVADQYWREIDSAGVDADILAEFIGIGSKLLYIKSCALLPSAEPPSADLRDRIDQAAGELTELLEEHKRFKDAVDIFRQLEEEGRRTFARTAPVKNVPMPSGLEGVTLDTLLSAVKDALAHKPAEPQEAVLHIEAVTVNEKMAEIRTGLAGRKGRLPFRPLLTECQTRTEIVVLFLAVLELIKAGQLWAEQDRPFGDIVLIAVAAGAPEPA